MPEEYKYCPRCGDEYDPGADMCADCFVPLVSRSELERIKSGQNENEASEAVVHITRSGSEAREVAQLLQDGGIDARIDSIDTENAGLTFRPGSLFHVIVAAGDEEKARFAIQIDFYPPSGGEEVVGEINEKVLRLKRVVEAGEEGLESLVEFFGDEPVLRHDAVLSALELGEKGFDKVTEWVSKICRQGELGPGTFQPVGDACMFLADENCPRAAREFGEWLNSADFWMRKNFVFALGKLGCDAAIVFLVSALRDPDAEVRNEAIDHLYKLEHTDHGFDPDVEPELQAEALWRWDELAAGLK